MPVSGATCQTNQVSVLATPTQIIAGNYARLQVTISNTSINPLYIGNASVTTTTGFIVGPGAAWTTDFKGPIYGVVASATALVSYWETSNP